MQLRKISYKNETTGWELRNLELGQLNLIVGQNAVGKSRTLETLKRFKAQISNDSEVNLESFQFEFVDGRNNTYLYSFVLSAVGFKEDFTVNSKVIEEIKVNNVQKVHRAGDKFKIDIDGIFKEFEIDTNTILSVIKTVSENDYGAKAIRSWIEGITFLWFIENKKVKHNNSNFSIDDGRLVPMALDLQNKGGLEEVVTELNGIGFAIKEIGLGGNGNERWLYFKEETVETELINGEKAFKALYIDQLSTGLRRTVNLLITLKFLQKYKKPSTLIIDDFCEGLDYERAAKLGKLVFDKCKDSNVQLIAASNDNFLMDVIDIQYWNILQREGSVVTCINEKTHPEVFEKFRRIGLLNSDLLMSNFLPLYAND
jgi:energy-coupling factor transporter ATP-binding protein EcfA2